MLFKATWFLAAPSNMSLPVVYTLGETVAKTSVILGQSALTGDYVGGSDFNKPFACFQDGVYTVCVVPMVIMIEPSPQVIAVMGPKQVVRTEVKNIFDLVPGDLAYPEGLTRRTFNVKRTMDWFLDTDSSVEPSN